MKKTYLSGSPSRTKKLGEKLVKGILKEPIKKQALVLGLKGELGSGKTTFLQGFAEGLGIKEKILSPTFVIIKKYKIKNLKVKSKNFIHIDCYRARNPKEILSLGFKEIVSDPQNIIAIEWAEKIRKIIPEEAIWIKLEFTCKTTRKIMLK